MKESDIAYEVGRFWVYKDVKRCGYTVFEAGAAYSTSDSTYPLTVDGLTLAKARVDYLFNRHKQETNP
jgi:hypothetical protein